MENFLDIAQIISAFSGSLIGIIILVAASLTVAGFSFNYSNNSPTIILNIFLFVAFLYAVAAIWNYWDEVKKLEDGIFLAFGLFLVMIAGMFSQVAANNYKKKRGVFEVSKAQLIYPMLFSPIVFYPVWALGGSQGASLFLFYSAYLNGYFWESIVSDTDKVINGSE